MSKAKRTPSPANEKKNQPYRINTSAREQKYNAGTRGGKVENTDKISE